MEEPPPPDRRIAVLIATKNRESELANRALASVLRQTRAPDFLVVVDDSDHRHREANLRIVQGAERRTSARVRYLRNDRTPGASGAWNVGLDLLHRDVSAVDDVMVAILDDDDAWEPEYLAACHAEASGHALEMVATDIVRHEAAGTIICAAPDSLDARDFLVKNPGVQGSNLYVSLGTLLAAGLFDEALSSCTDRDLCIRIADLGITRFGRLARPLVHHHADEDRARLSTPGSSVKLQGVDAFYRKYRHRMSELERNQFLERAVRLFGWRPAPPAPMAPPRPPWTPSTTPSTADSLSLVVGMVTPSITGPSLRALLEELAVLRDDARLANLEIVLLENGPRGEDAGEALRIVAHELQARGVDVALVPMEEQAVDAARGVFGEPFEREGRVSIAQGRTMLQLYVHERAKRRPGAVAWILDDDSRLENLVWNGGPRVERRTLDVVGLLVGLRHNVPDPAVAIGTCTDAPPLPFASCVRTQLVDAWHNLELLAALDSDAPFPELLTENMQTRARFKDYYYDLSRRETDHLETPFWYVPNAAGVSARHVLREIVDRLPRILAGEQVFRPLVHDGTIDPLAHLQPSVHRGGNTFVFDIEALRDFPNGVPTVGGVHTRRSDMVWTLLNQHCARRRVEKLPLPVRQNRSDVPVGTLDLDKLATDIQGYALYSALDDILAERSERRSRDAEFDPRSLDLDETEIARGVDRLRKYLRERLFAFQLSFHRAAGLVRTLRRFCDPAQGYWWLREGRGEEASVASLREALRILGDEYDLRRLPGFHQKVLGLDERVFRAWIETLRKETRARRPDGLSRLTVGRASGHRVLGRGSEGLVVTDDKWVYKLLSASNVGRDRIDFLKRQRWEGCRTLYPLRHVRAIASSLVLVYPFEPSSPYRGGRGDELRLLLDECREVGVVLTNVHPDNLIVTASGLKFIDYGADVEPWSSSGWERMARRVFLSGRYPQRPDLRALLRRSIEGAEMPELQGLERFLAATLRPTKESLLDARLEAIVLGGTPRTALDHGCGKGRLAMALARVGLEVTAFDPAVDVAAEIRKRSGVRFVQSVRLPESVRRERFDAVVSSLVLCTIEDDEEVSRVLGELRDACAPGGRVVIAICNPESVGASTLLQSREPCRTPAERTRTFKTLRRSGVRRPDVHRPLPAMIDMFTRAGLRVRRREDTISFDPDSLEPSSDFLILELEPCGRRKS